jgi:hydroxyethylthiazole kinase
MIADRPLILNLTNIVTVDFVANGLLSAGASPVMSEDPEDALALAGIASGICINIGTLNTHSISIYNRVLQKLEKEIPILLDPVGAGATKLRTQVSIDILNSGKVRGIRGNASEIAALAGQAQTTKGVDSTQSTLSVRDAAIQLAKQYQVIVIVSGEVDIVTDGREYAQVYCGSPTMAGITGTGCVMSAYLTAVLASGNRTVEKIARAVAYYGYLGELADRLSKGTGTFKVKFLDCLSQVTFASVERNLRFELQSLTN